MPSVGYFQLVNILFILKYLDHVCFAPHNDGALPPATVV